MEQLIRRVRFFNGQFLKQEEFREEQAYGIHLRRRINYVLFQDGVVQVTAADLTIAPESPGNPADKRIRVRRGMAIGANEDVFESREIILREDSAIFDLSDTFAAGDRVWVTVNYSEKEAVPVPIGSSVENSRVEETAEIQLHDAYPAGKRTVDGDPLIVLGAVDFDSMAINTDHRQIATLRSALVSVNPSISISPNSGLPGTSVNLAVTSSGGLDLSTLTPANIAISPAADITNISVSSPTTNSATIGFDVGPAAAAGARTLTITIGSVSASATFTVQSGLSLASFTGVDVPGGDLELEINGSGFAPPVLVEFSAAPSGFTAAVPVPLPNVSATRLRIPMGDIPSNATQGPVRVQSGSQTVTSGFSVTPPAIISTSPAAATPNSNITITGERFFAGTAVILPGGIVRGPGSSPPFPAAALGESLTETSITVRLASSAGTSGRIRVTTDGGTVQSSTILTVT